MNALDIARLGFTVGEHVIASTISTDDVTRAVPGLRLTAYDIPLGCAAGTCPECNPLLPLWHYAADSFVPAAKWIPIRLDPEVCYDFTVTSAACVIPVLRVTIFFSSITFRP